MDEIARALCRRLDGLKAARSLFDRQWQDLAEFMRPGRADFTVTTRPGEPRTRRIYDTTAIVALDMLTASLATLLVSPGSRWFGFEIDDPVASDPAVRQWLQDRRDDVLGVLGDPGNGFYAQLHEVLRDLATFGTGVLFSQEAAHPDGSLGMRFEAVPLSEVYLAENHDGRVDTLFRPFRLTAAQARDRYGADAGPAVARDLAANRPEGRHDYLQVVLPGQAVTGQLRRPLAGDQRYASIVIDLARKTVLRQGGFFEFPYQVPRFEKLSQDAGYGRAPGTKALPSIRMINAIAQSVIRMSEKASNPTLFAPHDGWAMAAGRLDLSPGAVNFHDGTLRQDTLFTEPQGQRPDMAMAFYKEVQNQINAFFLVPLLRSPDDGAPRTAFEIAARQRERATQIGPVVHRLQQELLMPLIERLVAVLGRRGLFPPPPPAMAGHAAEIMFVSPMSRSAARANEAEAAANTVEFALKLAAADPSILDVIDTGAALRSLADAIGAPAAMLRDDAAIAARRATREAWQQADLLVDSGERAGRAINQLAQAAKHAAAAGTAPDPAASQTATDRQET